MNTTRYFEVKVTGCHDHCKHVRNERTKFGFCAMSEREDKRLAYLENRHQLTDTCPMWNETKESETK